MKTKIKARKKTVIKWVNEKFGSLEMLAGLTGIDTTLPAVRQTLEQVRTSREPVVLSLRWRNVVLEVSMEHHLAADKTTANGDPTLPFETRLDDGIPTIKADINADDHSENDE